MPILTRVQVRGEPIDISSITINRMLYGPEFAPPAKTMKFDYRMRERNNQCLWLAQALMDVQPPRLTNLKGKIYKSTLTLTTKFWWAVVRLQLFPTGEDNVLGEDRVVLIVSLMTGFLLNTDVIIEDEMRARETKFSISYPFPCLVTRLCKEAHVQILVGIDVDMIENKKHDLEKSKDEIRHNLQLHKTELACFSTPLSTSTPSTYSVAAAAQGVESTKTSSAALQDSQYAFTPANFAKLVKRADRHKKQNKLFAEQLGSFVDRDMQLRWHHMTTSMLGLVIWRHE
ncbi:hypothetical protein HAX54_004741 [Datura stramonium]|uniref:Putative plant transposon protein domain-containing protein n=1 Tax=Datura stramonium TaxID=4076 RepID=A0ABS8WVK0_DATST|nr:hypothetical protein [Datura stramonium]